MTAPDNASIEQCVTKQGMFAVVAHDLQSTIAVGTKDECNDYLKSARSSGAFNMEIPMIDSSKTLQDNLAQMAYMDMVDRQFAIAEMNYLISYGWRPCGFYQTPEGVWTSDLMWLPPPGYPTMEGKEQGVCTTHAVNSQRKQRRIL